MPKAFISYRRADSRKDAGRIHDRLVTAFGKDNIFKDVDDIPPGSDFRGVLAEAVSQCDVLLALIGKQWLNIQDAHGNRRLDNPGDFVRIEVQTGLQRDRCLVIPVLVDNAPMPKDDELPDTLRELAFKNAVIVRDDPDFHRDVTRLIDFLKEQDDENTTKSSTNPRKVTNPAFDMNTAITEFYNARSAKNWDQARELLAFMRDSGKAPRHFDIDRYEQTIWDEIEQEETEQEYNIIRIMYEQDTSEHVWAALQVFWERHPGYDPDNIASKVRTVAILANTRKNLQRILPAPFDLIEIPAGKVTLVNTWDDKEEVYLKKDKSETFDVPSFAIVKYPLTNTQFAKFISAGGYDEQKWWTDAGWQQKEEDNWTEPRYWQDNKWNQPDHPVVGVSWYEGMAFCNWLSQEIGEKIILPTEKQWQRAAQGDDDRAYPWGKEWDCERCNNRVSPCESNGTTPVTKYEGSDIGDSYFGVTDMAGNVWEWCLTDYETGANTADGTNVRVLRGGSWSDYVTVSFRTSSRDRDNPYYGNINIGFRIALSYT